MKSNVPLAPTVPDKYEEFQGWPRQVTEGLARYFLSTLGAGPRRCLVLGAATGINDALPLARAGTPADQIIAGDIEPSYIARLRERAAAEGLRNIEGRMIDVTGDLSSLGRFDLVSLLFVIHRLRPWEPVVDRLSELVASGGSFFVSEFCGPSGLIFICNEQGGAGSDPVSRLVRRYFDLLPEPFNPPLKSTAIAPVRSRLAKFLRPLGHRDFVWKQTLTANETLRRIEGRAYAPFFSTQPPPQILRRLREEFEGDLAEPVQLEETIRVYRFGSPQ